MQIKHKTIVVLMPFLLFISAGCATAPVAEISPPALQKDRQAQVELQAGLSAYQKGSYEEAIKAFRKLIEQNPGTPLLQDAHWMLAKSYEAQGELEAALQEYRLFMSNFPQTEHGDEATEKIKALEQRLVALPERAPLEPVPLKEYRIGEEDEVEISVYGEEDLAKTQTVRPDGKIAFPLIGDIPASGLTPDELREQITQGLSKYMKNPRVTVIITTYNSKQVVVLGEVKTPGLLRLIADINLLQGISRVGGVTEEADLNGALLIRDNRIVPVNFEKLLRHGDFTQNLLLQSNDTILIPNISAKKVFVLGEVNRPLVVTLKHDVTLIESISMAGGFTRDAESKNVLVVRGGLGDPQIAKINVDGITKKGEIVQNILLQPGDIIYVPKTLIANVDQFFEHLKNILVPIVLAETGIALYPSVESVLTTGETTRQQPIAIAP